jgi:hypothetical protein
VSDSELQDARQRHPDQPKHNLQIQAKVPGLNVDALTAF